jgi:hypothetical protein
MGGDGVTNVVGRKVPAKPATTSPEGDESGLEPLSAVV